jgi:cytidylate kinase
MPALRGAARCRVKRGGDREKGMPVITISRGSYSFGKEIAEKLALKLGYECVSREIILSASKQFNIPELALIRAVYDAPSVLDRLTNGKQKYVAYFRQALLECLQKDKVVYHGLGGHHFLHGIPHIIKVRIIADMEVRVAEEMRREGLSKEEAKNALIKDDEARLRWSQYVFGFDPTNPSLYDIVLHIKSLAVDDAVEIIAETAQLACFQPTAESLKEAHLLFLAARLQSALMGETPPIEVGVEDGDIVAIAKGYWAEGRKLLSRIDQLIDSEKEQVHIKVKLSNH